MNTDNSENNKSKELIELEKDFQLMATEKFRNELYSYLKSRQPLIYVTTNEESRFISYIKKMSAIKGYDSFYWDCVQGIKNLSDDLVPDFAKDGNSNKPDNAIGIIIEYIEKEIKKTDLSGYGSIFLLLDFHRFLDPCSPLTERLIKRIANISRKTTVIFVSPSYVTTQSLDKNMMVIDFPLPSKKEISKTLYSIVNSQSVKKNFKNIKQDIKEKEEDLIQAASGLTISEANAAYAKSVVMAKQIGHDPFDISIILEEKRQIIKKSGILEYIDSPFSIKDVGGLDPLIDWLKRRKLAFSKEALDYGLQSPKGVMLAGIPGTGKSLCAKSISTLYNMPLIRLDFGRMFQSLVGESERTIRYAIQVAESIAPCILGSTKIEINNKLVTIEELFDSNDIPDIRKSVYKNGEEVQRIITVSNRVTGCKDGKIINIDTYAIIRTKKTGNLIKIKTKSGKEITVTKNHLLMDGKGNMKKAKDFIKKDKISIVYNDSIQGDVDEKENIIEIRDNLQNV